MPRRPSRLASWIAAGSIGATVGLSALVLPTVAPPTPAGPPPVTVASARATGAADTVHAGWAHAVERRTDLVGLQWRGDPGAHFRLEARHGSRWRDVGTVAGMPADEGPDPGTAEARRAARVGHASEATWVGGADAVRVRLVSGSARDVRVTTIRSPRGRAPEGVAAASLTPLPGIISRAEWGADESLRLANCPEGPSYAPTVKLAVVHHTAGSNAYGPADSPAIMRGLYVYATQTLHYCDTHYNFLVDRYGQIFEGRFGGTGRPVIGAHTTGFNTGTVGIAVMGNFDGQAPPPAALDALRRLIAFELSYYGIDPTQNVQYTTIGGTDRYPAGSTITFPPVVGHRDPGITDCPGGALYAQLPAIRLDVARRIMTGPVDVPSWTAQAGTPALMVLNDYGGLFPAGGAPGTPPPGTWPGWPIARDVALLPGGSAGYVLDGFGALHPFGGAPRVTDGPYFGFDIARAVELRPGGGGYVLDGWGGIHPFGGAPPLPGGPYFPHVDIARRLRLANGGGAYLLDGYGGVFAFAGAPPAGAGPYWPGWDIARDLAVRPGVPGVYVMDGFGGVYAFGGAPKITSVPYYGRDVARGVTLLPGGGGYSLQRSGIVTPFGGAPAVGQARATYAGAPALFAPSNARALARG